MNDDRLTLAVRHADGRETRWGDGETDIGRIPTDLTFSSSSPGGFKELSTSVLRDLQPQADEKLLESVVVYGPGGQVVWEGRWLSLPRETGQANRMSPQAVGWAAHLADCKSAREIYVDRDLSHWQPPSLNRRIVLVTGNSPLTDYQAAADQGLTFSGPAGTQVAINSNAELWYVAPPGRTVNNVKYQGTEANTGSVEAATLFTDSDDTSNTPATTALTLDDTLRTATPATPERYAWLRAVATATHTPGAGAPLQRTFKKLAVYGGHALTTHAIAGEPDGLYAHDIIAHAVSSYAPLLNFTTGTDGTVQPNTSFVVPQAAYLTPTTAADIIADINKYFGWDWLVYDNQTFYWREAGSGTQWRARRADGASLHLDGESSDVILNAIYVSYTDGWGRQKLAGPPGSGADVTDASLQDTSATHPVNRVGIPEKSDILSLSQPTNDAGAILLGAVALYTRNVATRRGQITITGTVEHPVKGKVPAWSVRAGDSIIVSDLAGDVPRRIMNVSYQHATRTATLDLDNTPAVLDAMLEQIAVKVGGIL